MLENSEQQFCEEIPLLSLPPAHLDCVVHGEPPGLLLLPVLPEQRLLVPGQGVYQHLVPVILLLEQLPQVVLRPDEPLPGLLQPPGAVNTLLPPLGGQLPPVVTSANCAN